MILYLCWIPLNTVLLVDDVVGGLHMRITFFPLLFTVCHLVAMSSAVSNPVMYGFMNENFVREARALLFCGSERDRIRRSSVNTGTTMRSMIRGSASRASANGDAYTSECALCACNRRLWRLESTMRRYGRPKALLGAAAAEGDGETVAIALDDLSSSLPTPSPAAETNNSGKDCRTNNHLTLSNIYSTNTLRKLEANNNM